MQNADSRETTVFCFAEGHADRWEAFCVDYDLAVQGRSFEDVQAKLAEQIELYVEGAFALPRKDRVRLLSRRAPLRLTLPMAWHVICAALHRRGRTLRHDYTVLVGTPSLAQA